MRFFLIQKAVKVSKLTIYTLSTKKGSCVTASQTHAKFGGAENRVRLEARACSRPKKTLESDTNRV